MSDSEQVWDVPRQCLTRSCPSALKQNNHILLPFSPYSWLQCVDEVMGLIVESLDAWRSRQYDYYQRVLNGIL